MKKKSSPHLLRPYFFYQTATRITGVFALGLTAEQKNCTTSHSMVVHLCSLAGKGRYAELQLYAAYMPQQNTK